MQMADQKLLLIFSGYNPRAVIAFLRTLSQNKLENYAIVAASHNDSIFLTEYKKKVIYVRKKKQLDLEELFHLVDHVRTQTGAEKLYIAPSTESLNRFLLQYRLCLEELHCFIPLVNEELYIRISDKDSFCRLCEEFSLVVPDRIDLDSGYCMPFVAKPRKYQTESGKVFSPVLVHNENEYRDFIQNYEKKDFIFQEYIQGESYYLLFYFSRDGKTYCFSQQNLIQQSQGKSIIAACCSKIHYEREKVSRQYEKMFQTIGFQGLVMVELRKNRKKYYMIEANPRFWGPSQLFCDCGCNFFEYFLYDYHFLDELPRHEINYDAKYYWSGGVPHSQLGNEECMWHTDPNQIFMQNREQFIENDIYCKPDTMGIFNAEREKESF